MTDEAQITVDRIKKKIINIVSDGLAVRSPYLISSLGQALGGDLQLIKLHTGKKLVEFLRDDLADHFQLVLVGKLNNIYALLPASARPEMVSSGEVVHVATQATRSPAPGPRYHYRFWAAFSVPAKGAERHLNLDDFMFEDMDQSLPPPEGWAVIPNALIAPEKADNRVQLISANIAKWIETSGHSAEMFLAQKSIILKAGASVLEHVLDSLDRRQLQATSLTLDVVQSLLRKKI